MAEAWLVDLEAGRLELHRGPGSAGYRDVQIPGADEAFAPAAFPEATFTLPEPLG